MPSRQKLGSMKIDLRKIRMILVKLKIVFDGTFWGLGIRYIYKIQQFLGVCSILGENLTDFDPQSRYSITWLTLPHCRLRTLPLSGSLTPVTVNYPGPTLSKPAPILTRRLFISLLKQRWRTTNNFEGALNLLRLFPSRPPVKSCEGNCEICMKPLLPNHDMYPHMGVSIRRYWTQAFFKLASIFQKVRHHRPPSHILSASNSQNWDG